MKAIATAIAAGLALGCLSTAGPVESQAVRVGRREEVPPAVLVRIDGRRAAGAGELRVTPDREASKAGEADLVLRSDQGQRIELRESAPLVSAAVLAQPALRLQYEQQLAPDAGRVFVALLPLSEKKPALLVHLDLGGRQPIRKEILPGLIVAQRDEHRSPPDVNGAAALRTWLTVEVQGAKPAVTLEGGETRTISYRGASYRLHVYRSLRRDPGKNPRLPFEGERYLLTATLTPQ